MSVQITDLSTHFRINDTVTQERRHISKHKLNVRAHPEGFITFHNGMDMIFEIHEDDVSFPVHTDVYDLLDQVYFCFNPAPVAIAASNVNTTDFQTAVALRNIPGASIINIMSYANNLQLGTERLLWNDSTNVAHPFVETPPSVAAVLTIVSTSVNDTAAGTGARTITVKGLNASFAEISEIVTLNGTTPVVTVSLFIRVNNVIITTAGSLKHNDGEITVVHPTPSQNLAKIEAIRGLSAHALYSVKSGFTFILNDITFISGFNGGTSILFRMYERNLTTGIHYMKNVFEINGQSEFNLSQPITVTSGNEIFWTGEKQSGAGNGDAYLFTNAILTDNTLI